MPIRGGERATNGALRGARVGPLDGPLCGFLRSLGDTLRRGSLSPRGQQRRLPPCYAGYTALALGGTVPRRPKQRLLSEPSGPSRSTSPTSMSRTTSQTQNANSQASRGKLTNPAPSIDITVPNRRLRPGRSGLCTAPTHIRGARCVGQRRQTHHLRQDLFERHGARPNAVLRCWTPSAIRPLVAGLPTQS
jgi:hypothetical protein